MVILDAGASLPEGVEVSVGVDDSPVGAAADQEAASFDAELDQLYLRYKIRRGLKQVAAGETVPMRKHAGTSPNGSAEVEPAGARGCRLDRRVHRPRRASEPRSVSCSSYLLPSTSDAPSPDGPEWFRSLPIQRSGKFDSGASWIIYHLATEDLVEILTVYHGARLLEVDTLPDDLSS